MLKAFERTKDVVIFKGSGKVFCAGGDVKEFTEDPKAHYSKTLFDYATNCKTYEMIANYRKPYIALVDGLAMGGAAFFATQDSAYRVATERTAFSMPEAALGYFNDAGGSYFLGRLEKNFGVFMGMTGYRVKGYDMKKVKLAKHFIESSKLDEVEKALMKCKTHAEVKRVLDSFETVPPSTASELDEILPKVEKCFGAPTVEEIYENLRNEGSAWALKTIETLNRMSPTSLKVTHRSINLGKKIPMRESLKMELRLVMHFVGGLTGDFLEGIRAVLVEKDNKPSWNPRTLEEVTDEYVEDFFAPLPEADELKFDAIYKL